MANRNLLYGSGNSNRGCINLEGWDGEGDRREVQERWYMYIPMADLGAPKSLEMVIVAMKLKDTYSLEGKL